MEERSGRRGFLTIVGVGVGAGASMLAAGCKRDRNAASDLTSATAHEKIAEPTMPRSARGEPKKDDEVTATEDLMREHGVIRRVLVLYRESAARLRGNAASVPGEALLRAARLMRSFGEDYHEHALEETYLFPALAKAGGPAATNIDSLLAEHRRGREITQYVIDVSQRPLGAATVEPLAHALEAFARMYEAHAALEDTVIFPAWKKTMSSSQLDEMGERFEDIEKKSFGGDGFDDALAQITALERMIGLDYHALIAPPPPKH
jgi:hemerythrin-like domain-containing protein